MKKKIFLMVAAILALCLTCGMLLVACNKGGNTGGGGGGGDLPEAQESWSESVATMNDALSQKLKDNKQFNADNGRKFVADFELELAIDDKTEKNADASYKLIGRANINVDAFDTQFYLAITENKEGYTAPKTLFGLGYEDNATNPYFYININGGGYKKINAFSLHQLMLDIDAGKDSGAVTAADGGIDFKKIIDQIMADPTSIFGLLNTFKFLGENGTRANYGNSFIYDLKLPVIVQFIGSLLNDDMVINLIAKDRIESAQSEEEKEAIIDEVKAQIADVIHKIPAFAEIDSVNELWQFIVELTQFIKVSFRIDFAENSNQITGMGFTVNYIENNDGVPNPVGDYKLSLNKIRVDIGDPIEDIFAGTGIDEVADAEAINILKFSIDGVAIGMKNVAEEGATPSYEENHRFTISVDADLNPFALMELVGRDRGEGADTNIANAIKKLGYLHIEINEVNAENEIVQNILLIHTKTEEGYIIAQFSGLGSTDSDLGGVYNIQELVEYIGVLSRQKSASAAADVDFNKILEIAKKVIGYVKDIWAMVDVDFKNIASEGVTLEISNLLDYLVTALNVPSGGMVDLAKIIRGLDGDSDLLNIKVSDAKYGVCDTVDTKSIKGFVYGGSDKLAVGIKEGAQLNYTADAGAAATTVNGFYFGSTPGEPAVTFIDINGQEFVGFAHLYYVDYDPSIVGQEQTVTAYFGQGTLLTNMMAIMPGYVGDIAKYPLSGIMSAQFKVTIPAPAAA